MTVQAGRCRRARRLLYDCEPVGDEADRLAANLFKITRSGSFDTVVRQLTQYLSDLTGLDGMVLILIEPSTLAPTFIGGNRSSSDSLAAMEASRRDGASMSIWHAFVTNQIVIERGHRQRIMGDPALARMRPHVDREDLDDLLAVPLSWDGSPIGVLAGLFSADRFGPDALALWRRIAHEAAAAIQYAAAISDARHSGTDHERLRMREDLHDTVSQRLFGLGMLATRAKADADNTGHPGLAAQVQELRTLVAEASRDIRVLIGESPPLADATVLSARLAAVIARFSAPNDLHVEVDLDPRWDDLNQQCTEDATRIVRECLRNVVKHAHASRVSVRIPATDDCMLLIEVVDDGTGFDPRVVGQASFGLSLISERARERGGTCEVDAEHGSTIVRVRLEPEFESEWHVARRALEAQTQGPGEVIR